MFEDDYPRGKFLLTDVPLVKKWKEDWNNVIYCSERCRRSKHN
ncbi:MAG: DUF2256 domain-containing protein [Gammaproteobacteria bacterium]|nr:DUF2256 domain-containing protein [Gammaproteobacteria bacterium]NIN62799.1 DUF2256 domain-containing protein [Gammaproteobacteria bacterium]NIO63780.1 DUF2256 domain-containing protein [Gammaproteobacteria bacterium]NIP50158.1 DUF2256 domain-containing protein [Gammaproteobacteria bacterium]NIQ12376.1 DUF2256 domain-containing protein [Gammaproteobacteria bacterium]